MRRRRPEAPHTRQRASGSRVSGLLTKAVTLSSGTDQAVLRFSARFHPEHSGMAKVKTSRVQLEAIVLVELRRAPHCAEAASATIYDIDDDPLGRTWYVGNVNPGGAGSRNCDLALAEIVPRLQKQYDLKIDEA